MARLDPAALQRLRHGLQKEVDDRRIPGAVAWLSCAGEPPWTEALGLQDAKTQTPMAVDAIFRIYSMTKPIVSLAALMLAEEGRLMLGEPVATYLPAFGRQVVAQDSGARVPAGRPSTVHDLLRHTAGLTYEFLGDSDVQRQYKQAALDDDSRSLGAFADAMAQLPLAHQPGSCWHYSRATDVLGAVVQTVAGQPLGEFLQRRILGPLGMHDTAFHVPASQHHRIAEPFVAAGDAPVRLIEPRQVPLFESGGGGLMSTAADYARFAQCMLNEGSQGGQRLVSRSTVQWMTCDHLGTIPSIGELLPPGHGFGLGVAVRTHAGLAPTPGSPGMYYWSGIAGTSFFVDPRERLFAILLTQAPAQRIYMRNLFRHLVYACID